MLEAGNNLGGSLGADELLHENSGGCMELRGWREGREGKAMSSTLGDDANDLGNLRPASPSPFPLFFLFSFSFLFFPQFFLS